MNIAQLCSPPEKEGQVFAQDFIGLSTSDRFVKESNSFDRRSFLMKAQEDTNVCSRVFKELKDAERPRFRSPRSCVERDANEG